MNAERIESDPPRQIDGPETTSRPEPSPLVVKVGGSLLDLTDLADRLRSFIDSLAPAQLILVVGGGPAADLVRRRDRLDDLDGDRSHWLAVRAMSFNSFLIEALLPNSTVVSSLLQCQAAWAHGRIPILDPHSFLLADEASGASALPHRWSVTSDTIAARIAQAYGARDLMLLKSVSWPADASLESAADQGVVDEYFPREIRRLAGLRVRIVNLRATKPPGERPA